MEWHIIKAHIHSFWFDILLICCIGRDTVTLYNLTVPFLIPPTFVETRHPVVTGSMSSGAIVVVSSSWPDLKKEKKYVKEGKENEQSVTQQCFS